jgi:hypothetical protein
VLGEDTVDDAAVDGAVLGDGTPEAPFGLVAAAVPAGLRLSCPLSYPGIVAVAAPGAVVEPDTAPELVTEPEADESLAPGAPDVTLVPERIPVEALEPAVPLFNPAVPPDTGPVAGAPDRAGVLIPCRVAAGLSAVCADAPAAQSVMLIAQKICFIAWLRKIIETITLGAERGTGLR